MMVRRTTGRMPSRKQPDLIGWHETTTIETEDVVQGNCIVTGSSFRSALVARFAATVYNLPL